MKCENLCLKMVRRSLHKLSSAYVPDFTVSMYFAERVSMISYVCVFLEGVESYCVFLEKGCGCCAMGRKIFLADDMRIFSENPIAKCLSKK